MSFNSPKALVLDFGGVISRTLFETHDLSEQALKLAPGTLTWRGPFDPAGDRVAVLWPPVGAAGADAPRAAATATAAAAARAAAPRRR